MGGIFTIVIAPFRAMLALTMVVSVSMVALTTFGHDDYPHDPFAPYAGILPGQPLTAVLERGFTCQYRVIPDVDESCVLVLERGVFSKVEVSIAVNTSRVRRVVFAPHELTLGNLELLWDKPEVISYGHNANLRWRTLGIIAIVRAYRGHFSHWLPVEYVVFEVAHDESSN